VSENHAIETAPAGAVSPPVRVATDVLQATLLICVVGWALDLPRRLFGLSFYTEQLLAISLGLSLAISFVNARLRPAWLGWAAAAIALGICGLIAVRYEALTLSIALMPAEGIAGSAILILLVLEATRRSAGGILVVIILVICAYVFIGPHMPGDFATRPVSLSRLLVYLGIDVNGMIGNILSVAVLIVVPFTLMGQVLGRTGGAHYFADLAMSAMGNFRGGAAKIAVVGSALFGMISGSAVSNVLAVGIVTIPAMVKSGFTPYRAAAIESVGSTGGQLMPPVMGAAAFIMAEFLQVSYGAVCIAAAIPAVLYYACLFIHVDLEAAKQGIGGVEDENMLSLTDVLMVVLLGDASQNAMAHGHESIVDGMILVSTILFWNYSLDWLAYRLPAFDRVINPPPLPLVKDGKMLRRNMRQELITETELMSQVRAAGIENLDDVRLAVMEGDGHISVVSTDKEGGNSKKKKEGPL